MSSRRRLAQIVIPISITLLSATAFAVAATPEPQVVPPTQQAGQTTPPTPPVTTPTGRQDAQPGQPNAATEAGARSGRGSRGPGGSGRRGRGRGEGGDGERSAPKKPRRGIPVTDPLILKACIQCHAVNKKGHMTRISYMRKSPEMWEITLKRMVRRHGVFIEPEQARSMLRYLASQHGLARTEAERGFFESERRVHLDRELPDDDLKKTCAACHSRGRVFSEQRDAEEWKLLKATHLAFFPLAGFQSFRGRGGRRGGGGAGGTPAIDFQNMSESEIETALERRRSADRARGDRADKVLGELAKKQPLFSPEWEDWQVNRREVPLAATWTVIGHEPGVGDIGGTVRIKRLERDTYETTWRLEYPGGKTVTRTGKGLLYAGYSWRGRSELKGDAAGVRPGPLKEVLLLNDSWDHMKGRLFNGAYNEFGIDIALHRHTGATRIFGATKPAVMIGIENHTVELIGEAFPSDLVAADFNLGEGVTVHAARRVDSRRVELVVSVDVKTERGRRRLSFRAHNGPEAVVLYDTVDYIKISPGEGLARTGGAPGQRRSPYGKQYERFEALAMNRGADEKLYTKDDYAIEFVPATWKLEEFNVRENDDDLLYVGGIDSLTGLFTPAIDGPNPERRWQANNVGDVYVVAEAVLNVRKMPEKKPEPEPEKPDKKKTPTEASVTPKPGESASSGATAGATENGGESGADGDSAARPSVQDQDAATPTVAKEPEKKAIEEPEEIVMVRKTFRARGHLLVTVPLYARWDRLEWRSEAEEPDTNEGGR